MKNNNEMLSFLNRSTWLEIDLDVLTNNMKELRRVVGSSIKIIIAAKANAYGYGLIPVCKILFESGADMVACGSIDDGIELRKSGVVEPILIFASNTITEVFEKYIKYNLIPTIIDIDQAKSLSQATSSKPINIFIKVDAGRGRLGPLVEEAFPLIQKISKIPKIEITGVYSHISGSDWPENKPKFAERAVERFDKLKKQVEESEIEIPIWQIANSAAAVCMPNSRFNGCCTGRVIYGYRTFQNRIGCPKIKPGLSWKSRIIQKKKVVCGKFGPNFSPIWLKSPKIVGIIPTGIFDGIPPTYAKEGEVLVNGKRAKIISSISLEHTIIDLSNCLETKKGDEVTIIGKQGNGEITMNEFINRSKAQLTQVLGRINVSIPRLYFKDGKLIGVNTRFGYKELLLKNERC